MSRWTMPRACAAASASATRRASASALGRRRRPAREALGEVLAVEPLHREVGLAVRASCRARRSARSPGARARRARCASRAKRSASVGASRVQHLERDALAARAIARAVDGAHPAGAGEPLDLEAAVDQDPRLHPRILPGGAYGLVLQTAAPWRASDCASASASHRRGCTEMGRSVSSSVTHHPPRAPSRTWRVRGSALGRAKMPESILMVPRAFWRRACRRRPGSAPSAPTSSVRRVHVATKREGRAQPRRDVGIGRRIPCLPSTRPPTRRAPSCCSSTTPTPTSSRSPACSSPSSKTW